MKYLLLYSDGGQHADCYVPLIWTRDGYTRDINKACQFENRDDAQAYLDTGGPQGIPYAHTKTRGDGLVLGWTIISVEDYF